MKKLLAIASLLFLFSINGNGQENWIQYKQIPGFQGFSGIKFFDSDIGYATGGRLVGTVNGGNSWDQFRSLPNCGYNGYYPIIFWKSPNIGWCSCYHGSISKTIDGGATWNVVNSQYEGTGMSFETIYFVSDLVGWVAGEDQTGNTPFLKVLLKTIDGGVTWHSQTVPNVFYIADIFFLNENVGYACGGSNENRGSVYHTTDGGEHWQVSHETPAFLSALKVVDAKYIWAVGIFGTIISTTDGGISWVKQSTGTSEWYHGIDMIDTQTGIAVGQDGLTSYTNDGGATWQTHYSAGGSDIDMVSQQEAWSVGLPVILHTLDGGRTWTTTHFRTLDNLNDVQFTSRKNGWAVGDFGKILHTSDSGKVWDAQKSGVGAGLTSLSFINDSTGWVAGKSGTILRTIDRGETWKRLASGLTTKINKVFFVDSLFGWISALKTDMPTDHFISATIDGGKTWVKQKEAYEINDIFFLDRKTGWAVGSHILMTEDGGNTWSSQKISATKFSAVYFSDRNNGWAVGATYISGDPGGSNAAVIFSTSDGGVTWHQQVPPTVDVWTFTDVYFLNNEVGWAIGTMPTIIVSTRDGGKFWLKQTIPEIAEYSELQSVHFTDSVGWVVGGYDVQGVMLRTDNYGGNGTLFFRPAAPTDLTYKFEPDSSITLQWADNSGEEIGFQIERGDGNKPFTTIHTAATNQATFQDHNVPPNLQCTYRVAAVNSIGLSAYAYLAPMPPSNLFYEVDKDKSTLALKWTDNANNESDFLIEAKWSAVDPYRIFLSADKNTTVKTSSYQAIFPTGGPYYFRVSARNSDGTSPYSNEIQLLSSPDNLTEELGADSVMILNWVDTSNGEAGFEVQRKDGVNPYETIYVTETDEETYRDAGFPRHMSYSYRVRAVNNFGRSEYSGEVIVTGILNEQIVTSIFPNPTDGRLRIEFPNASSREVSIAVFNTFGGRERSVAVPPAENGQELDLSDLAAGVYILQVEAGSEHFRTLIIKR